MREQLLLENTTTGQLWDVTASVHTASWVTNRTGGPGVFRFTLRANHISFTEGDQVSFFLDGQRQFFGWVFTKVKDEDAVIQVTCYDRLRYPTAKASYAFYNRTAAQILTQIAGDFQLALGEVADTGYVIPSLVEQSQSCLDIIQSALRLTYENTGVWYVLYDDGDGLSLADSGKWTSQRYLGTGAGVLSYRYTTDIDGQTYNRVTLGQATGTVGCTREVTAEDPDTQKKWGVLQLYRQVSMECNTAQMRAQAQATLAAHDRRMRTLWVSALGVPGLRAGQRIYMNIPNLGDIHLDQYVTLDRVIHLWEGGEHLMELETLPI